MLSLDKYRNLIAKIDIFMDEWGSKPPFRLNCRLGCDECCHNRFTLFAVEVAAIAEALAEKGVPEPASPLKNGTCPFLSGKKCLIYDNRPILCRTQGYPLLFTDDHGRTISDICGRNRTGDEVSVPAKYVLNLETLNRCLSSVNFLYLAEMEERGIIVPARLDIIQILDYPADL